MIEFKDGNKTYYYDPATQNLTDAQGVSLYISSNTLENINTANLTLFIGDLFKKIYEARDHFETLCNTDKGLSVIWERP